MQHYIIPLSGTATAESSWSDVSELKVTCRLSHRVLLNLGFNTTLTWLPLTSRWIFFLSGSLETRLSHSAWREHLENSGWWQNMGWAVVKTGAILSINVFPWHWKLFGLSDLGWSWMSSFCCFPELLICYKVNRWSHLVVMRIWSPIERKQFRSLSRLKFWIWGFY